MACGGCKARGEAIVRVVKTAATGKTDKIADDLKFVVRSSIQDAGSVLRQQTAAARQRLGMRR